MLVVMRDVWSCGLVVGVVLVGRPLAIHSGGCVPHLLVPAIVPGSDRTREGGAPGSKVHFGGHRRAVALAR